MALVNRTGRINHVQCNCAFIAVPNVNGSVMMHRSSMQSQCHSLMELLQLNDIVQFSADPYDGLKNVRFFAREGSVFVTKKATDVEKSGTGTVFHIDNENGYFGLIETEVGTIFFNANAVQPKCAKRVDEVVKLGSRVSFVAVPQPSKKDVSLKATKVEVIGDANGSNDQYSKPHSTSSNPNPMQQIRNARRAMQNMPTTSISPRRSDFGDAGNLLEAPPGFGAITPYDWEAEESAIFNHSNSGSTAQAAARPLTPIENGVWNFDELVSQSTPQAVCASTGLPLWMCRAPESALKCAYDSQMKKISSLANSLLE